MIQNAFVIAMIVFFIYMTFRPLMIFGFVNVWLKTWLPKKLWKPVFDCPICMTPWYGSIIYFALLNAPSQFVTWMLTVGTAAGITCPIVFLLEIVQHTRGIKEELKTMY